jgi:hypothetical protein
MVPSQKGEKIGAQRLAFYIYPYRSPYYQEGHSADGVGEFYLCTKPYAPISHPICVLVERTSQSLAVAAFSGQRLRPLLPRDSGLELWLGRRHFASQKSPAQ